MSAVWCPLTTPTSYLGFSYLGCGISLHGCSSKVQPLLLTSDVGELLSVAAPVIAYRSILLTSVSFIVWVYPLLMEICFPFFFCLYRYIYENIPVPLHIYDISKSGIIESNNMSFNNFTRYSSKTKQIYLYIPTHNFLKVSLGGLISTLWTEEPDGLQSMELQRVGHDWMTKHNPGYAPSETLLYASFSNNWCWNYIQHE